MGKQKRSENTYTKINTVFKRDKYGIIMPYEPLVMEELEYLRNVKFDCEEKIDGTNTRIEVTSKIEYMPETIDNFEVDYNSTDWPLYVEFTVAYKGKTDNAQMPKMLDEFLKTEYPEKKVLNALGLKKRVYLSDFEVDNNGNPKWKKTTHQDAIDCRWVVLDGNGKTTDKLDISKIPTRYTLYGEGYGAKIQGCGGNYLSKTNSFIGFDVKVNDEYLLKVNRDEIFNKLGAPIVPFIGQFTVDEAIDYVKTGFKSTISENKDFIAEGLVCRTPIGLKNRRGERIMFKVKTCDWNKYYAKYGTYDKVEQEPNEHY